MEARRVVALDAGRFARVKECSGHHLRLGPDAGYWHFGRIGTVQRVGAGGEGDRASAEPSLGGGSCLTDFVHLLSRSVASQDYLKMTWPALLGPFFCLALLLCGGRLGSALLRQSLGSASDLRDGTLEQP